MKRSLVLVVVVALAAVLPFQLSAEVAIPEPPQECPDLEWVVSNIGGETSMWTVGEDEGCDFVFKSGGDLVELAIPDGSLMTGWDSEKQQDMEPLWGPNSGFYKEGVLWIETQAPVPEPTVHQVFIPLVFGPALPRLPIPERPDGCPEISWLEANIAIGGTWVPDKPCGFKYDGPAVAILSVPDGALVTGWDPFERRNFELPGPGHIKVWDKATVWFE